MIGRKAFFIASACALTLLAAPLIAAERVTLNQVWSRLADANGELGSVETAQFSPDGRFIVSGSKFDNMIVLWRASDGAELWRTEVPQEVEKVVWTRDGKHVASVSEDRVLRLIRADTGKVVKEVAHASGIDSVEVSHDGRWLVTGQEYTETPGGARAGIGRVFSLPGLTEVATFDHGATINEMDWTSDDALLVSAGDNSEARVWRTSDWTLVRTLSPDKDELRLGFVTTRLSPDGKLLAVSGFGGDIHVWDMASGERVRRINRTGRKIETVTWSPDGRFLLSAGHDEAISFYRTADIANPEIANDSMPVVRVPVSDHMEFMQFSPRGPLLATSHQDGTVQLWTYVSDDPTINERRHAEVRRQQDEAAGRRPTQD